MDAAGFSWMLASCALVLVMTPGVAFFYGGLVRAKSVVSMMMLSFGAIGVVGVLWALVGFSMATVPGAHLLEFSGSPLANFGLAAIQDDPAALLAAAYGGTFAIITIALISGSIADRAKFGSWLVFAALFALLGYFPIAAWVWGGGWIMRLGEALGFDGVSVIDYAGGTAVHINAGAAAMALALVLGRRVGFARSIHQPHNVPLTLIGGALLWFGWFGFNAGAAGAGDLLAGPAGLVVVNTLVAPAAGILGWIATDAARKTKPSSIGAVSGAVAGLVGITPCCADIAPGWAIVLGLVAGTLCCLASELKFRFGYDDSLDVVGLHLVGGLLGSIWPGLVATKTGLLTTGDPRQLVVQVIAALAVLVYAFVLSLGLGWAIQQTIGFRVRTEDEVAGVDAAMHGETAYALETGPTPTVAAT
ncbi:Ammonia channel [Pseudoclavibacter triregionum]|nr:Ammonia channel [Pseudoclavibacter triregionum]